MGKLSDNSTCLEFGFMIILSNQLTWHYYMYIDFTNSVTDCFIEKRLEKKVGIKTDIFVAVVT